MSETAGRLHIHLHSRNMLKLWEDEKWTELSSESLIKSDKVFQNETLAMARPKQNHDNSKGDEEEFDDVLTVRGAMQILQDGTERADKLWTDKGHLRLLSLASTNNSTSGNRGSGGSNLSFGILR